MQNIWRDFPFFETILVFLMSVALILTLVEIVLFGIPQHDFNAWESIEPPKDTDLDCWRQKENHNNVVCYPKHTC